ncbi:MAG TPA: M20 family metallopeptidase [Saprospiraceae bacterium]|nr:M20 family metallopeptidase [Saprospiraceae bacterium]
MTEELKQIIRTQAKQILPEIIILRRAIHQHPELSFQEVQTSRRIQEFLKSKQISFETGWAGHGLVVTIEGEQAGPVIMLRADMDALPIQEMNDVEYRSVEQGIMHACGHDVHSASMMGVAAILNEHKSSIRGKVKLIFQPGEEKLPGGASIMIREGLLEKHKPEWIAAQHVFPSLPAGHVGFRSGLYMASADELYITIHGKGGHAAMPHLCIDPVMIAARVVTALQEIVSRTLDPIMPAVLSIGKIYSDGGATNVIPDRVFMEGTLRAMDESWRKATHQRIKELVEKICAGSGAKGDVRIEQGYPCLVNDEAVTQKFKERAMAFLGPEKVHDLPLRLTSEDFAFYSQAIPATFYRLGTGFEGRDNPPVHTNRFDIDESALETGIGLMAYIVLQGP